MTVLLWARYLVLGLLFAAAAYALWLAVGDRE
jgi:hypothetical protein